MRLAYFDCFSGISGNMVLSALVHAGADLDRITEALDALPTIGFLLDREEVEAHGIAATRVHVKVVPQGVIRTYASIRSMLEQAEIPERARWNAQRIFYRMALADAKIHNRELDVVTFHDASEDDSLVGIVGSAVALDDLGVERVFSSPVPTGLGMVRTEHGLMPVPGPVVSEILQGVPTYSRGLPVEMVTPSGAAILASLAEGYGDMPVLRSEHIGYGAGAPRADYPNVLRVVVGEEEEHSVAHAPEPPTADGPVLVQANLTGLSEDEAVALLESLFEAGADDAWLTPVIARQGPASRLSVVVPPQRRDALMGRVRAAAGAALIRVVPAYASGEPERET